MKKIIALLLVVLCILPVFAGCSAVDAFKEGFQEGLEDGLKGEVGSIDENEDNDATSESNKEDEIDISKPDEEEKEPTTSETEKSEFKFGKVNGQTYTNEFAGISCTLPNGWIYYTEEEIKSLNNLTIDMLDDKIAETIKNAKIVYDMQVTDPSTGNNASINFEKLPSYAVSSVKMESILKNQFPVLRKSLEDVGATIEKMEYEKITVNGKEFDGISIVSKYNGVSMEQSIISFQKGDYLVYLTVTATQSGKMDTLLSYFSIN